MRSSKLLPALVCAGLAVMPARAASPSRAQAWYQAGDYARAIRELTPMAEAGQAESQYLLAMSQRGQQRRERRSGYLIPVEGDALQQQSHDWFGKAAAQGHAEAMAQYAEDLDRGYGVPVDYAAALEWMQKAHGAGSNTASARLEAWYREGHIVKPDLAKAAALLAERPAAQGMVSDLQRYSNAMRALQASRNSRAGPADEAAATAGDAEAARRLATRAYAATPESRDCDAAIKWNRRAGELGLAEGYYELGVVLSRGSCGAQDMQQARELFEVAAMTGHWSSLGELSRIELFGHTGTPDYAAAYRHRRLYEALKNIDDDPGPNAFARRHLSTEQLAAADAQVERQLPVLRAKMQRQAQTETLRQLALPEPPAAAEWSYSLMMIDRSGACARNFLENCRYVPFQTALELTSRSEMTLACTLKLKVHAFAAAQSAMMERRYVVLPRGSRRFGVGNIAGDVDAAGSSIDCVAVPQPSIADGTCAVQRPPGGPQYPPKALREGREGVVVAEVGLAGTSGRPSSVTVAISSGVQMLDEAALKYLTETSMQTNCPGIPMRQSIEFRIAN